MTKNLEIRHKRGGRVLFLPPLLAACFFGNQPKTLCFK